MSKNTYCPADTQSNYEKKEKIHHKINLSNEIKRHIESRINNGPIVGKNTYIKT